MTKNVLDLLKREFNSSDLTKKIKQWLEDEIQASREVIAEYTFEQRSKCDDGSDDFIEGQFDLAERLLSQIKEWQQ